MCTYSCVAHSFLCLCRWQRRLYCKVSNCSWVPFICYRHICLIMVCRGDGCIAEIYLSVFRCGTPQQWLMIGSAGLEIWYLLQYIYQPATAASECIAAGFRLLIFLEYDLLCMSGNATFCEAEPFQHHSIGWTLINYTVADGSFCWLEWEITVTPVTAP